MSQSNRPTFYISPLTSVSLTDSVTRYQNQSNKNNMNEIEDEQLRNSIQKIIMQQFHEIKLVPTQIKASDSKRTFVRSPTKNCNERRLAYSLPKLLVVSKRKPGTRFAFCFRNLTIHNVIRRLLRCKFFLEQGKSRIL